jgi:cell wall-associated NlpC family hydrolase
MISDTPGVESVEITGRAKRSLEVSPRVSGYFDDEQQQKRLLFHALKLEGTPFVPHAMIPGAGIDCIGVNAWVYLRTGALKEFRPPKYSIQGGKHLGKSQVLEWLKNSKHFSEVREPQIGDTLVFKFRQRVEHHVGLKLYQDKFIHVLENRAVEIASLRDFTYARTLQAIYRPLVGGGA